MVLVLDEETVGDSLFISIFVEKVNINTDKAVPDTNPSF
jgi:hypothetical protein